MSRNKQLNSPLRIWGPNYAIKHQVQFCIPTSQVAESDWIFDVVFDLQVEIENRRKIGTVEKTLLHGDGELSDAASMESSSSSRNPKRNPGLFIVVVCAFFFSLFDRLLQICFYGIECDWLW